MKKQILQNKKLDEIGIVLLKSIKLQCDEIEKIVNSSCLFYSIKLQIKIEEVGKALIPNNTVFGKD